MNNWAWICFWTSFYEKLTSWDAPISYSSMAVAGTHHCCCRHLCMQMTSVLILPTCQASPLCLLNQVLEPSKNICQTTHLTMCCNSDWFLWRKNLRGYTVAYVLLPFSLSRVLSLSRSLSLRRSMSGWVSVCLYVCVCARVPLPLLPRFSVCLYVCSGTQHVDSHTRSDLAIPSNALSFV